MGGCRSLGRHRRREPHSGQRLSAVERTAGNFPAGTKRFERRFLRRHGLDIRKHLGARNHGVALNRNECDCFINKGEPGAQILTNLALHGRCCRTDGIYAADFIDPFGCSLRAAALDARDVVYLVAHEREVRNHGFGRHAVFFNHAFAVVKLGIHGVEEHHVIVDKLRHILVARRNDRVYASTGSHG